MYINRDKDLCFSCTIKLKSFDSRNSKVIPINNPPGVNPLHDTHDWPQIVSCCVSRVRKLAEKSFRPHHEILRVTVGVQLLVEPGGRRLLAALPQPLQLARPVRGHFSSRGGLGRLSKHPAAADQNEFATEMGRTCRHKPHCQNCRRISDRPQEKDTHYLYEKHRLHQNYGKNFHSVISSKNN